MTTKDLRDRIDELIAADPELADAAVTFGDDRTPVLGGLVGHQDGKRELNLAPLKLDRIGGF